MMYTLTKKFRFESAHRLAKGYKGKCANIHGHSWNGHITVEVRGLDKYGMAYDYTKLKEFTQKIEKQLDHSILLYEGDHDIIKLCRDNGWSFDVFKDNPTSEIITKDIFDQAEHHFPCDVYIKSVTIEETCTTSCTYTR